MKTFETLVTDILHIPTDRIRDDLTPNDVPDWDSMNYLLFIAELEKTFSVSFTMDEVLGAATLGAVKQMLISKGVTV